MAQTQRPVSPHLQVYKWSVTMASSIFHRATGVALGVGTLVLAWWLIAAATSDGAYALVQSFLGSIVGRVIMLGFLWSLIYHMMNGLRHLLWDLGYGFEIGTAQKSGWLVFIAATLATIAVAATMIVMGGRA